MSETGIELQVLEAADRLVAAFGEGSEEIADVIPV